MNDKTFFKRALRAVGDNSCILGLLFMIVVATMINPLFLTSGNISNVLRQMSTNSIIALGMAVVIISGSIDLSVGSMYCLCATVALYFCQYSLVLGLVMTLLIGVAIGTINGLLIIKVHIHPWIATLSMMLALRGLVLIISNQNTYRPEITNEAFISISRVSFLGVLNWPIVIMIAFTIITYMFMKYTGTGRSVYACGGNNEAARMMGIKTDRILLIAHMYSGFTTAVAAIILASRIGSMSPLAGDGGEMYAIAACVVGGVHLAGGRGRIPNVFVGAAIIGMLTNVFNMQDALSTFWESVITGALVLIVVLIQQITALREERKKKVTEAI